MIIGYARVSSKEQNLDRQIEELKKFGCEKIFTEKESGKDFNRPVYKQMRSKLRFGDVLVVHDLSRFGRNKEEIKNEWKSLIDDEIDIVVLNMPILDTRQYKNLEGVGKLVAERASKKNIKKVVFDRGGYLYHGRVQALADAARENGLEF